MNSTLTGPVATYLAQVKAELRDLPPGELADVLDDVTGHLSEVAAEFEEEPTAAALQDRLGTPRQYADELRTAAGYPPPTASPKQKSGAETALRWGIVAAIVGPFFLVIGLSNGGEETLFFGVIGLILLIGAAYLGVRALHGNAPDAVLDTKRGSQGAEFVAGAIDQIPPDLRRELVSIGQPVWWVARGIVGGGAIFALSGATAVAVVGALVGAVVSVWIGRKTQQDRRWLWYIVPLNVVAAIIVPVWLAFSFFGSSYGIFANHQNGNDYVSSNGTSSYNSQQGLLLDGNQVGNIYPFDAQGRQVPVRLYDQDGKPINLPLQNCAVNNGTIGGGEQISNLFPQTTVVPDVDGNIDPENCKESDKAPFVPPPAPATTPTATTPPATPSANQPTPATTSKPSATPPPTTGKPGVTLTITPTR
ncbi:hypothetical protein [Streptomyces sp. SID13031]|uniref:DUF1700 domain-containing protein n=1 Tax=Streptomyces sp. SID13031 TaxID=2706046 RepID=UPI0013CCCCEA|nr:hypothetical protein [Streptomyces sp. SID13031]NEA35373.1 hypothetical protein [Streptomyces sp. SID13031]